MAGVMSPDHPETNSERITRLVETHQMSLKRLCILWMKDASLAEDAVQETFLKAYRSLDSFHEACSEKTWLTRIAVNVCRNLLRGGWFRHVDRHITLDALPEPSVPFTEFDDTVFSAVNNLPKAQREVVLLYFYQDMTMKEIAETLRIAPSNVSRRLAAAKKSLRGQLEGAFVHDR